MKVEQAKQLADQALNQLIAAVEAGGSDAFKAYLATMARFHRYSFGNVMMIAMQRPDATQVAGFNRWKELGRYVKAGERGIAIIAPMLLRKKSEPGNGDAADGEDAEKILRFKAVYVFDVSQTDGQPLPELHRVGGNPNGHTDRLKQFIAQRGIVLEYSSDIGTADGLSKGGTIVLRTDLPPAEEFSVLVHELAHEMLHRTERRKETNKTVRETEAEAVAFIVSQAIGLDTNSACSDYIRLYNGDRETLTESLDFIQKSAAAILEAISEAS
ncbi:MAG: DUF1738 domain-containing protein [Planctomycetota bacterium]|nr:MAG: DUF1738 domain-containing protein [Planctomycetota bacterium]